MAVWVVIKTDYRQWINSDDPCDMPTVCVDSVFSKREPAAQYVDNLYEVRNVEYEIQGYVVDAKLCANTQA